MRLIFTLSHIQHYWLLHIHWLLHIRLFHAGFGDANLTIKRAASILPASIPDSALRFFPFLTCF